MKSTSLCRLANLSGAIMLAGASVHAQENFNLVADESPSVEGDALDMDALDADASENKLFSASVRMGARYDSNIYLRHSNVESDLILSLAPTLSLANNSDAENTWAASYTPSARVYLDHSDNDGVDHNFKLDYGKRLPKTELEAGVEFRKQGGSNQYASGFFDETYYGAHFTGSYWYSGKTRLTLDLNAASYDFGSSFLIDRTNLSARLSAMYQATGKINIGPYISYSQVDVETGADHSAIGGGARFEYSATGKTAIVGLLGYENRSFSGSGAGDSRGATTFEVGFKHQYSPKTQFEAMLFRNVQAGYSTSNSGFTATGVKLNANYSATDKIRLRGGISYENDSYYAVGSGAGAQDDRQFLTLTVGGDYQLSDQWILGSQLLYRESFSDLSAAEYNALELGVNATYQF